MTIPSKEKKESEGRIEEEKGRRERKLWTHIPHEHRCKTVGKILANEALYKK